MRRVETIPVSGGEVKVHGLTMAQVHTIKSHGEGPDADKLTVVLATDTGMDEVEDWYKTASAGDVEAIIRAAFNLSRVEDAARFPAGTAHDAGAVGQDT